MSPILHDILVGLSLCADCFAVSLCTGMTTANGTPPRTGRKIIWAAVLFGIIQTGFLAAGWGVGVAASSLVAEKILRFEFYARLLGFLLLLYVGGMMLADGLRKKEDRFSIDALAGILMGAVATSIDALAVGITFACTGYVRLGQLTVPLLVIGVVSFVLSVAGFLIGVGSGKAVQKKIRPELLGGVILIGIGTKILLEHLLAG